MTGQIGGILAKHEDSVEAIAFCQSEAAPFCVSVGMDVNIFIYSLQDMSIRQKVKAAETGGFSKIVFSDVQPECCYVSSTQGKILIMDVRNGNILRNY